jgi:UDP-3-O-[3-hydroxymyristoyl] N-acetylglucosamine deacetylase
MLDCVGDLYLAGAPLLGSVSASRSGHRHNNRLLHTLFATPGAFRYVDLADTAPSLMGLAEAASRLDARLGAAAAD